MQILGSLPTDQYKHNLSDQRFRPTKSLASNLTVVQRLGIITEIMSMAYQGGHGESR